MLTSYWTWTVKSSHLFLKWELMPFVQCYQSISFFFPPLLKYRASKWVSQVKAKPQLFIGADNLPPLWPAVPHIPQHLGCVTWVLIVFSFSWPHEKRPGPRSNQRDFLLESMLMAQHLFKCLLPYTLFGPSVNNRFIVMYIFYWRMGMWSS